MHFNIEIARTISLAYNVVCKPICKELDLPQTAFDILMFLGNNPKYKTAGEIVEIRHIKANLVSVNVDKLVREGYLERKTVAGDRRKTELICTEKAMAVISRGERNSERISRQNAREPRRRRIESVFVGSRRDKRKFKRDFGRGR